MTLPAGARLGPYQVESALGAGGMGEVYRARDTRLERTVAIKVLPAHLSTDPQFRERFEREARTISQLTHPHICTLHDVGEHEHTAFLVMEHLEGETLGERLKKGQLPIHQVVSLALEIASALEAAHRRGVVHRDLKPGNIMLTKSGAKLLDFGLAKVGSAVVTSGALPAEMQTVAPLTAQGTILGTFQYMAPEQLEGAEADARADIWAFGCVLYEMVAGRPAFEGKTQVSLIGAILERDPAPLSELQPLTPPALARVIRTCLVKEADDRFQSAHDVRLQLQWIQEGGSAVGLPASLVAAHKRRIHSIWAGTAAVAVAITGGVTAWSMKPLPAAAPVVTRFEHVLPEGQSFTRTGQRVIALSPDGTKLVYVANEQLYLREMDALDAQPIRGTNEDPAEPVFSPDGAWLAYFVPTSRAGGPLESWTLKKIPVTGGTPVTLAQIATAPGGASWGAGMIVFGMYSGVQGVPEGGGTPRTLTAVDPSNERVAWPQLMEDGEHVLFSVGPAAAGGGDPQIVVQRIAGGERRVLIAGGRAPHVLRTGHLVYFQNGTLFAARFDAARLTVSGGPMPVGDTISWPSNSVPQFAVASGGALAFRPGAGGWLRRLVWVDRDGHEEPIATNVRAYGYARLSPDGTRIALASLDEEYDIWVYDLRTQTLTRVTFGPAAENKAIWTPDGQHLLFGSGTSGAAPAQRDIFRRAADGTGTPEALTQNLAGGTPLSVSPDGRSLVLFRGIFDLFLLPLEPGGVPRPLLAERGYHELNGELSPDGRWIAYQSNESGRHEIYVRPFPNTGDGRWQISSDGGQYPLWARSGRELLYVRPGNRLVSVPVESGSEFSHGTARPLFDVAPYLFGTVNRPFDISPDGQRFLMTKSGETESSARPSLVVVSNWLEELKARVPVD